MDTVRVFFDTDNAFLNARAEKKVEAVVKKYGSSVPFIVLGYADYPGDTYYNDMLAMRRAQSTVAQLKKNGVDNASIKMLIGKGEVSRDYERRGGYAEDRRVDIIIKGAPLITTPKPTVKPLPKPTPPPVKLPEVKKDTIAKAVSKDAIRSLSVGQTLKIENLYFVGGRDIVTLGSEKALDDLYKILKEDTALIIRIEGHICCTNHFDDEDGMDLATGRYNLSYTRAKAVYDYLVYRGIKKERLSCKGMGHSVPATRDESTEASANMNRRVEIRIINK